MNIDLELLSFLTEQADVQEITVPEGVTVCHSGDLCENLVIVLEGQVKVFRPAANGKSLTLYYLNKQESCTLTASCILNGTPFPAFAVTTSDVRALSIPPDKVISWLGQEPLWQKYIFSLLSQRMISLIELVDTIAFESLDVRLVNWLLVQENNSPIQATHQQIADDLASSREVISRLLKKLERKGLISVGRGTIIVNDNNKLRSNSDIV